MSRDDAGERRARGLATYREVYGKNAPLPEGDDTEFFDLLIIDQHALNPRVALPEPDPEFEMDPERQRGLDGLTMAVDRFIRDVIRLGEMEDESFREVTLPEQRAGTLMVFRTFDRLSYAIVMNARRAMHLSDIVRNP